MAKFLKAPAIIKGKYHAWKVLQETGAPFTGVVISTDGLYSVELIPARSISNARYCNKIIVNTKPHGTRLFYIENVSNIWTANEDTLTNAEYIGKLDQTSEEYIIASLRIPNLKKS